MLVIEEMIEAAKKARIHEFIQTLPEGYDTYIGERGVKIIWWAKSKEYLYLEYSLKIPQ